MLLVNGSAAFDPPRMIPSNGSESDGSSLGGILLFVSLLVYVTGFGIGPGACFWTLLSEVLPGPVRDQGMGLANVEQWFSHISPAGSSTF